MTECGEILLREGHEIHGVIAPPGRIADWADRRSLRLVDPSGDYGAVLARAPFDHLFAITHFERVPDGVLSLPLRGAINFHDGPLPDYAGRNAPMWALVNGESRHGITWHFMTSVVDGGEILKQATFDISRHDTSLSLNTKCFEAALDSFEDLVAALAARTLEPQVQDPRRRRAHSLHQRPAAACAVSWKHPALEIEAFVRALDFGRYRNVVGLAKVHRGGRVFGVTQAVAAAEVGMRHAANGLLPGCGRVLELDAERVLVATGLGAIELRGFSDLSGRPVSPTEFARELALASGSELDELSIDAVGRLSDLDRRMSRSESRWVRSLADLDALSLPVDLRPPQAATPASPIASPVIVPEDFSAHFPGFPPSDVLTAAFCAFLSRIARRRSFDVAFSDPLLRGGVSGLEPFVTTRVPLHVAIEPRESLAAFVERLTVELSEIRGRGPLLQDVIARHPELSGLRGRLPGQVLPVGIDCRECFAEPLLPAGADWTLEVLDGRCEARVVYDASRIAAEVAESLRRGFSAFLASLAAQPGRPVAEHEAIDARERALQFVTWTRRARPPVTEVGVHASFRAQVLRTPTAVAVVARGHSLTFAELDRRVDHLAVELRRLGVRRGDLVGVCVERSPEMVIALLGTLAAGAAYVPLDPAFPAERLTFMIEDSALRAIVTQGATASLLSAPGVQCLAVDARSPCPALEFPAPPAEPSRPEDLAYVIYTSGSTGRPKGVLVEHRNVTSFFAAMDEHVPHDPPGVWLAVTSLSFDISVLELLWTLTRGFKVVLYSGREHAHAALPDHRRPIDFSLFFFSADEAVEERSDCSPGAGYRLLLEGAKFADEHGFRAVWTPERHFHAFGGLYPNPAVIGAALAVLTRKVEIRAGSVVLPLHHPIRVAEEWSLVDKLSSGRVGISFASGWHPNDFVLAPQNLRSAKEVMFRDIEIVRRLWRGESVAFLGANGAAVSVETHPRPAQRDLPVWVTSAGNVETFTRAGRIGANLLTHVLGQSVEQVAPKIAAYRAARAEVGLDPATGIVTLMLHTFVGADEAQVKERLREPLERYLASSLSLLKDHLTSFPAFRRPADTAAGTSESLEGLSASDQAALLVHARERYYESFGLFGTPDRCHSMVERLRDIGVDEIACLIDFGVPAGEVLAGLPFLDRVRLEAQRRQTAVFDESDASIADLIRDSGVTHLQCTPSMARVLVSDAASALALRDVPNLFLGGEALPESLADALTSACGSVTNLYGPTETTIWSSAHRVTTTSSTEPRSGAVPIGRPLANTVCYVLDEGLLPVPLGVAGELVIGGEGVARGYLGRPELDEQRFVSDPYSDTVGARMYRTGDLVRYRRDGVLLFLGRTDQQLKVRGHRIEPGEIESLLEREPSVAEAVVVAREDSPGNQRLVAYVVNRGGAVDGARLRERLAALLPGYMVPAQFVFLERIPRTPNMKVDRRALETSQVSMRSTDARAVPSSTLERQLAQLWQTTLGIESVGIDENFFDLGGHSVLAILIHRRLCELTPMLVSLTDIFRFPTIRTLAAFLARDLSVATDPDVLDSAILRGRRRRSSLQQAPQRASEV